MLLRLDNNPRTHDYRKMFWGHALQGMEMVPVFGTVTFWQRLRGILPEHISNDLKCTGHGDVRKGDFLLIAMASDKTARFKVEEIEHYRDPDDMFKINKASFVGYEEDV